MVKRPIVIWSAVGLFVLLVLYSPILWAWSHRSVHYWETRDRRTVEEIKVKWNHIIYHVPIYNHLLDQHAALCGYDETGFAGASENSIAIYSRFVSRPIAGEIPSEPLP